MNSSVTVNYIGAVKAEDVQKVFAGYDAFLFPTKGENFGHVIFEAMGSGCIPIISNQTIWQDLDEKNCGFVIDNNYTSKYRKIVDDLLKADINEIEELKKSVLKYAKNKYDQSTCNSGYVDVFSLMS